MLVTVWIAPMETGTMSPEDTPAKNGVAPLGNDPDYWHALIKEKAAAAFLGVTGRSLQKWRQVGGGPRYVSLSARCLRYRRIDLKAWSDERLRKSTADSGGGA